TMRGSAGQTRSVSRTIKVAAPELWVSVYDPAAEYGEGKSGDRHELGDTYTARVVVGAGRGVGNLTDVAPTGALLTLPPQLELVGARLTIEPLTLAPGDRVSWDVDVKAVKPGDFALKSTWDGTNTAGGAAGPVTGTQLGSVAGLRVEILPDPAVLDLKEVDP